MKNRILKILRKIEKENCHYSYIIKSLINLKKKNGDEQSPLFILRVVKCKVMTRYPDKPPVEIPLASFINK